MYRLVRSRQLTMPAMDVCVSGGLCTLAYQGWVPFRWSLEAGWYMPQYWYKWWSQRNHRNAIAQICLVKLPLSIAVSVSKYHSGWTCSWALFFEGKEQELCQFQFRGEKKQSFYNIQPPGLGELPGRNTHGLLFFLPPVPFVLLKKRRQPCTTGKPPP